MNGDCNGFPISAPARLSYPPSIDRPAVQSNARLCPRHTLPRPTGLPLDRVHHAQIAFNLLAGLWPPDKRQNRQNPTKPSGHDLTLGSHLDRSANGGNWDIPAIPDGHSERRLSPKFAISICAAGRARSCRFATHHIVPLRGHSRTHRSGLIRHLAKVITPFVAIGRTGHRQPSGMWRTMERFTWRTV